MGKLSTWRPGRLADIDAIILNWCLVAVASIRATDYLVGMETVDPAASVTTIERLIPLHLWSALLYVGAILLAVGMLGRKHALVWGGHAVLATCYAVIGSGIAISFMTSPWWDGVRAAGPLLFIAFVHSRVASRTGPRPLDSEEAGPSEMIVGEPE